MRCPSNSSRICSVSASYCIPQGSLLQVSARGILVKMRIYSRGATVKPKGKIWVKRGRRTKNRMGLGVQNTSLASA